MNLEKTQNKLSEKERSFLKELSEYLDTKLYFIGSVQRADFDNKYSDIDIVIFSENEGKTKSLIQHFLNIKKDKIKKVILKFDKDVPMVYGYKIKYESADLENPLEFVIYNEKYKKPILKEHIIQLQRTHFYIVWALIVLKFMYYKLNIIDYKTFNKLKRYIMHPTYYNLDFVVLENV